MVSSLFEAVEKGTLEDLPEALKTYAAQINANDTEEGYTPLQIATKNRNKCMVKVLLDGGANPNIACTGSGINKGYTATHMAAKNGDTDILVMLSQAGADLNCEGSDSWLPIHSAAFAGKRNSILCLLDNGAKVDGRNRHGLTALMYCANHGKLTETRDLLKRGADITVRDLNGDTVLHHALHFQMMKLFEGEYDMPECQYDTMVVLAMNGADPDVKNNEFALCTEYTVEGVRDLLRILYHHREVFAKSNTEWNYMTLLSAKIEHFLGMGLPLRHATDLYDNMKKTEENRLAEKKRKAEENQNRGGCPVIKSKKKAPVAAAAAGDSHHAGVEVPKDGSDPSGGQCPFFQKKDTAAIAAPVVKESIGVPVEADPSGGKCPHFQKQPVVAAAAPAPMYDVAPNAAEGYKVAPSPTQHQQHHPQHHQQQQHQSMTAMMLWGLYENRTSVLMCIICFLLGVLLERKIRFT